MHSQHATRTSCHAFRHGFPSEKKAENGPQTALDTSFDPRALERAPGLRFSGHVGPILAPCWSHVGPKSSQQQPKRGPGMVLGRTRSGPGAAQGPQEAPGGPQEASRGRFWTENEANLGPCWVCFWLYFGQIKVKPTGDERRQDKTRHDKRRRHRRSPDKTTQDKIRPDKRSNDKKSRATATKRKEAGTGGDDTTEAKTKARQATRRRQR